MIYDRLYEPDGGELLFHYCADAGFRGIVTSRSMWASAFNALNDPAERRWGYDVFIDSCKLLRRDVGDTFLQAVRTMVDQAYASSMLMVCSLSLHADSENQWRRYADQGRGYAIGFSAEALRMPAKPLRILYDRDRQLNELTGNLRHVYDVERGKGFRFEDDFQSHCFHLGLDLCAYKDPAFSKENEIRYAHIAGKKPGPGEQLIALGARGPDGERLAAPLTILQRFRGDMKVSYVTLDWSDQGRVAPVRTVVLGPNNAESEPEVIRYLALNGLTDVQVSKSAVALR